MTGNGTPPGQADRSLGEIVAEVSEKASLLVREEIDLAKAEVTEKVSKLGKGAAAAAAGGVFLVFSLIYFFFALAFFFNDLLDFEQVWLGFAIVFAILLVLGGIAVMLALRLFKSGSPPTPELAIEEARLTREAIEEARS